MEKGHMPRQLLLLCLTLTGVLAAGCADYGARKKPAHAAAQTSSPPSEKKQLMKKGPVSSEKKSPPAVEKKDPAEWTVEGWGKTEEDSKKYAAVKVSDLIK